MRRCVSCWEKYGYLQTYGPRIYEPSPHLARALPGCAPRSRGAGDVLLGAVVEGAPGAQRMLSECIKHVKRNRRCSHLTMKPGARAHRVGVVGQDGAGVERGWKR
jgi:hypothetical protein